MRGLYQELDIQELDIATYATDRLTEQRARPVVVAWRNEHDARVRYARIEERGGDRVDADRDARVGALR